MKDVGVEGGLEQAVGLELAVTGRKGRLRWGKHFSRRLRGWASYGVWLEHQVC